MMTILVQVCGTFQKHFSLCTIRSDNFSFYTTPPKPSIALQPAGRVGEGKGECQPGLAVRRHGPAHRATSFAKQYHW